MHRHKLVNRFPTDSLCRTVGSDPFGMLLFDVSQSRQQQIVFKVSDFRPGFDRSSMFDSAEALTAVPLSKRVPASGRDWLQPPAVLLRLVRGEFARH